MPEKVMNSSSSKDELEDGDVIDLFGNTIGWSHSDGDHIIGDLPPNCPLLKKNGVLPSLSATYCSIEPEESGTSVMGSTPSRFEDHS